ncbi:hypothetical protein EJ04DRAFT_484827 [Polyplosphaeria fusca]|uniref:Uncharacterized protein n=1 Tax=Polyplosphaeria fusca TaxID=682080 RepID=A0A9P4R8U0_9PLEO|nr:hypothetical protein EJ04DRAFT_484827 [Polyplosphaeria fusca]
MDEAVEILVHISAAATRRDDELHRALADSYLGFESYTPNTTKDGTSHDERRQGVLSAISVAAGPPIQNHDYASLDDSLSGSGGAGYGSFPSHISTQLSLHIQQRHISTASYTSDLVETSRVHSSWLGCRDRTQLHRKTKLSRSPPPNERTQSSLPGPSHSDTGFIEDTQLAAQALVSQLPDHGSTTSEDTCEYDTDPSINNYDVTIPSQPAVGPSKDFHQAPLPRLPVSSSRLDASVSIPTHELRDSSCTRMPISNPTSVAFGSEFPVNFVKANAPRNIDIRTFDFSKLPFEVLPPKPRISVKTPGSLPSQMTTYLKTILQQNPDRFRPSQKLRMLDDDERGCWLLECKGWPLRVQLDFWSSVSELVRNGDIGWGATLHRVVDGHEEAGLQAPSIGQIRLYGWGELVEPVWLALWLCSGGMMPGTESKWLDGGEIMVLRVP